MLCTSLQSFSWYSGSLVALSVCSLSITLFAYHCPQICTDPSLHLHQIGETDVDLLRRLVEVSRNSASASRVIILKQTSNSHSFTPVFSVPRPGIYPREDLSDDDHPLYHLECFQGRLSEPLMSFIAFASGSYESYSDSRVNVVDTLRDTVNVDTL